MYFPLLSGSNKRGGGGGGGETYIFFVIFGDPPTAYFDPPFINFANFMRECKEVHTYITDSWCFVTISQYTRILMLSEAS